MNQHTIPVGPRIPKRAIQAWFGRVLRRIEVTEHAVVRRSEVERPGFAVDRQRYIASRTNLRLDVDAESPAVAEVARCAPHQAVVRSLDLNRKTRRGYR